MPENDPTSENETDSVIELQAPMYLDPKQNCLDQPPFNTLLDLMYARTNVPIEDLRYMLLGLSRSDKYKNADTETRDDSADDSPDKEPVQRVVDRTREQLLKMASRLDKTKAEQVNYQEYALAMGEALSNWPLWDDYLRNGLLIAKTIGKGATHGLTEDYDIYGNPIIKQGEETGTMPQEAGPSYAYWVYQQQHPVDARAFGIEEIFSETSAQEPKQQSPDVKNTIRGWKIGQNPDLIRE